MDINITHEDVYNKLQREYADLQTRMFVAQTHIEKQQEYIDQLEAAVGTASVAQMFSPAEQVTDPVEPAPAD